MEYKILGVKRQTAKTVYEKEGTGIASLQASLEWAIRKGADTVLVILK